MTAFLSQNIRSGEEKNPDPALTDQTIHDPAPTDQAIHDPAPTDQAIHDPAPTDQTIQDPDLKHCPQLTLLEIHTRMTFRLFS